MLITNFLKSMLSVHMYNEENNMKEDKKRKKEYKEEGGVKYERLEGTVYWFEKGEV